MRRLPRFEYHEPATAEEAAALLAQHRGEAGLIAGGTDLLISMKHRLTAPGHLISLSTAAELDFIEYDEEAGLRLGAGVVLAALAESPVVRDKFPSLVCAARKVGSAQVRNLATLGGNLCLDTRCWYFNQSDFWRQSRPPCLKTGGELCHAVEGSKRCFAVYTGDMAPLLIALGAEVKLIREGGERALLMGELFTGEGTRPTVLEDEELLTEVRVPASAAGTGAAYAKLRLRDEVDFPILGLAAAVDANNGAMGNARIVLNAVASSPLEVTEAGDMIAGRRPDDADLEEVSQAALKLARPVANAAGTPEYRRKMVPVLVKRALAEAWENARA